jgi:hypothetical protein
VFIPYAAARIAGAVLLLAVTGACAERGDFGRVKTHSTWNDILTETGAIAASIRREPVSLYSFTDDEKELRDRAWRFLVPAHEFAWFERALGDLSAKRVLPPGIPGADPTVYHRALLSDGAVSPASRYRRLGEDAAADARLLPALTAVANRVLAADGVRLKTLNYAQHVEPVDVANAHARVAENRCLVAWVVFGLEGRIANYRHALEHLVIETPQAHAIPAERSVTFLAGQARLLDRFAVPPLDSGACGGEVIAPVPAGPVPVVAKG